MNNLSGAAVLLLYAAAGAVIWAGICALVVVPQKIRAKNWNMVYDPSWTIIRFVVTGILGQAMFWFLGIALLNSVAYSKYSAFSTNAKMVYNTAQRFAEEHPSHGLQTVVGYTGGTYPEGSFGAYAAKYIATGTYYYAVTFDADGKPEYAYWSARPLDAADLHAHTREEVRRIIRNPFADDSSIVGGYSVYKERMLQADKKHRE